jgi:NAD(P)-dependent dehydrogenase (short-subunit alcohol dehydrogenase family)
MGLSARGRSVITGAGSGFGRALALELASRGGTLVLGDINRDAVQETARLAQKQGARGVAALACDVTKLSDVEALAAACERPIDLMVNNAGVSSAGGVGDVPMEDWRWTIEVDLFGVIHGCHVFAPILKKQRSGHVLNVASCAGIACLPGMGAYNVAKAGVIALSETLHAELHDFGVGVTVLCPTFFKTDIAKNGRFPDSGTQARAQRLVERGKTAEEVVRYTLRSIDRRELYCLPMADARWVWRVKRAAPEAYLRSVRKRRLDRGR